MTDLGVEVTAEIVGTCHQLLYKRMFNHWIYKYVCFNVHKIIPVAKDLSNSILLSGKLALTDTLTEDFQFDGRTLLCCTVFNRRDKTVVSGVLIVLISIDRQSGSLRINIEATITNGKTVLTGYYGCIARLGPFHSV